jgi:hypothetical protein
VLQTGATGIEESKKLSIYNKISGLILWELLAG